MELDPRRPEDVLAPVLRVAGAGSGRPVSLAEAVDVVQEAGSVEQLKERLGRRRKRTGRGTSRGGQLLPCKKEKELVNKLCNKLRSQ